MKVNWKQKLTSRKFWAAVITFITTLLVAFGVPDMTVEQVVAVVSAGATMIAYIIGEGLVDAAREKNESGGVGGDSIISCFKGKFKVTSPRGYRMLNGKKQYHGGLDLVALGADKGVYAIADGTVQATPFEAGGFGYYVRQILPDGRRIYYGHMAKGSICVKAGQAIKKGDKLGVMGATGSCTGAHTHIEIRVPGTTKDSLDICAFTGIPNTFGTYEADDNIDYAKIIKEKCGLEDATIKYLKDYKYGKDLIEKLGKGLMK